MSALDRISSSRWLDPEFRVMWAGRWSEPSSVPTSFRLPLPWWPPLTEHAKSCRSMRLRFRKRVRHLFAAITARDGASCQPCGGTERLVLDHVIPIRWGGTNDLANLQVLCHHCNSVKGGALPRPPAMTEVA